MGDVHVRAVLPPVVVVPAHPRPERASTGVEFELLSLPTGGVAAVGFSTVQLLLERMGPHQPWIMLPSRKFEDLIGERNVRTVIMDPAPGVCEPAWTAQAVRDLGRVRSGRVD